MKQKNYFLLSFFWISLLSFAQNGSYVNLDGVNDFIVSSNAITTNTQNQTYQVWFRINTLPNNDGDRLLQRGSDGSGGWSLALALNTAGRLVGAISATPGGDMVIVGTTTVSLNTWYNATIVFENSSAFRIYLNGNLEASASIGNSTLRNSDNRLRIGSGNIAAENFNGDIDEVRVWSSALTASDILSNKDCELEGNEIGLIAYYQFNEGIDQANNISITTVPDLSVSANNGTLNNFTLNGSTSNWLAGSPIFTPGNPSVTTPIVYIQGDASSALTATIGANGTGLMWYTTATGGTGSTTAPTPNTATAGNTSYWVSSTNTNGCESERVEIVVTVNAPLATHLNFDGVNDLLVSANAITSNTESQTYQAWFRIPSAVSTQKVILQRGIDGSGGWSVQLSISGTNRLQGGIVSSLSPLVAGTTTLVPNTWYHATLVIENNSTLRLYLNGVQEASASVGTLNLRNSDNRLRIGSGNIASEYFNGDIDEVRVWNKVLNVSDILDTMNCELQASETGLVVYYKFNQGDDSANNTTVNTLFDSSSSINNGTLTGFALTGTTSNWLGGSPVTTGDICATLGNSDFENSAAITIYPNPSKGIFNIVSQQNATVEIYDLLGKRVLNQQVVIGTTSIDISNLNTGVYLLRATDTNGNFQSHKLIKN